MRMMLINGHRIKQLVLKLISTILSAQSNYWCRSKMQSKLATDRVHKREVPKVKPGPSRIIKPQPGFQTEFLSSPADIVFGGGAAGAGKTWALEYDAMRWVHVDKYDAIIFRRTYPEITQQGGLWEKSFELYTPRGGKPNETDKLWTFNTSIEVDGITINGSSSIKFSHLQRENDIYAHQGGEYAFIGFDEVTHFTKKQFMYMISRNRSASGIRPIVRCTCNPDPNSWVAEFLEWWIDQESGFPDSSRVGKLRYFTLDGDAVVWGDTLMEVVNKCPHIFNDPRFSHLDPKDLVMSVTFIPGKIFDNQILLTKDPGYLGKLLMQDENTKLALLEGNWKVITDDSALFHFHRINDFFTNIVSPRGGSKYYIACDHARFGRDLCIIGTWHGWRCVRIDVTPHSDTNDIVRIIQHIRKLYRPLPLSQVIIDQDGIGVHDFLKCQIFQGGSTAVPEDPKLQVDYENKRTQCYYKAAEIINDAEASLDLNNIWLWEKDANGRMKEPVNTHKIKIKGKEYDFKYLIKEDLRTVRRHKSDHVGKKRITPKPEHKNAIGGRSPDWSDMIAQRAAFEYIKLPQYMSRAS